MDDDEGDVKVSVEPSASHYHAGEVATFTISFTNIRVAPTPNTPLHLIPRTRSEDQINTYGRSRGHRKAVSSVSEARMARPPTSPGMRRLTPPTLPKYTPVPSPLSSPSTNRKGLIGAKKNVNGAARSNPTRSLSIAITPAGAFRDSGEESAIALNGHGTPTTPTHPRPSPPRRSRTSSGIPLSHPHARKQSAALDGSFLSSHLQRVPPTTPSTATFSTSLAPITESNSLDSIAASPSDPRAGLGVATTPTPPYPDSPVTPSPAQETPTYSALILLAHAQITGSLTLDPPSAALAASWRTAELGVGRRVVGGGRMGIGVAPSSRPRAASGVGAWLGMSPGSPPPGASSGMGIRAALGLGGLASADSSTASLVSAPPDSPPTRVMKRRGHQRASSMASFLPGAMSSISALLDPFGDTTPAGARSHGGTQGGGGAGMDIGSSGTVEQGVYPVLESQPSVLAVDLTLQPGETRSYTYSVSLPTSLPPSFRGKHFRLTYYLVIGTSRPDAQSDAGQLKRVIRVPIRMYNHVAVGQIPRPYDLMWPLARRREGAVLVGSVEEGKDGGPGRGRKKENARPPPEKGKITRTELESYARKLLESNPNGISAEMTRLRLQSSSGMMVNRNGQDEFEDLEETNMSCRDAVEVVTRHSKKVSYDIAKDGKTVAVITFVKAAYRLGETVLGAIEFNSPDMEGRVLRYSATLESTESLALHTPAPQTRRHSEHHMSFAVGTQRAAFSLDIPSDAAPTFVIRAGDAATKGHNRSASTSFQNGIGGKTSTVEGGLQWRVRMSLVVCMSASARARYVVPDGPGNDWGDPWRAGELAPLGPVDTSKASASAGESWGAFFGRWTGEEEVGADGEEKEETWTRLKPEMLECELPIMVYPGSTAYQPSGFDTWA